jgi:hypothetical protein
VAAAKAKPGENQAMTHRRPLGPGPSRPDVCAAGSLESPAPRAQLAAEGFPAAPAVADPRPASAVGRRALGRGSAAGQ